MNKTGMYVASGCLLLVTFAVCGVGSLLMLAEGPNGPHGEIVGAPNTWQVLGTGILALAAFGGTLVLFIRASKK